MTVTHVFRWDLFISHAYEDKAEVVQPLATVLRKLGVRVWYDEFTLRVGDSLSRSIDEGLRESRFGLVVLSPSFFAKGWPQHELSGLWSREIGQEKVILPLWHRITKEEVLAQSPTLVDKLALNTADKTIDHIAIELLAVIRPDLYRILEFRALRAELSTRPSQTVPIADLKLGPIQHENLSEDLLARIRILHNVLSDVLMVSLEQTIENFRRDTDPESEIRTWEAIADAYLTVRQEMNLSLEQRKALLSAILGATLGMDRPQDITLLISEVPEIESTLRSSLRNLRDHAS
jgi:hypothetical protein